MDVFRQAYRLTNRLYIACCDRNLLSTLNFEELYTQSRQIRFSRVARRLRLGGIPKGIPIEMQERALLAVQRDKKKLFNELIEHNYWELITKVVLENDIDPGEKSIIKTAVHSAALSGKIEVLWVMKELEKLEAKDGQEEPLCIWRLEGDD